MNGSRFAVCLAVQTGPNAGRGRDWRKPIAARRSLHVDTMIDRVTFRRTAVFWALFLLTAGVPGYACAQQSEANGDVSKSVRIQRTAEPPVIDGVMNEEIWLRAPIIDDLHQVNPVEFAEPTERTEVRVLYGREALYIGARLYDSEPSRINARILRQNQAIGSDDRFFVHIDPFNTRRGGYAFGVNANGVRYDGIYEGPTDRQFDWDGIWQAAASIDAEGWVVEIEIPFKTISFDPRADRWWMNFTRNIERKNESIAWMSRNRRTDLSSMGEVRGISQIEQGRGLDVVPTASVRERRAFGDIPAKSATEPSVDVFYKVTPQLNASLTLNTDFSAVDVDNRQVNLTRFNLFFPEQRDFFLQDVDIFQFGRLEQDGRPFFSRRLGISARGQEVPLDFGGKLSGRVGRFDVGALAVRQEAFGDVDATTAFVGRVAANVLEESSVGMIMTHGDPHSNADNSVGGVDFRYLNSRFAGGRGLEGVAWFQQSDSEELDGDDTALGFNVSVPSNSGLRGGFGMTRIEENYNPALGFVRRTGIEQLRFNVGHTWRPQSGPIRTLFSGFDYNRIDYLDSGEIQSEGLRLRAVDVNLNSQDSFGLSFSRDREGLRRPFNISRGIVIEPGLYTFDTVDLSFRAGNQRAVGGGVFLNSGNFYDGDRIGTGTFFNWRPSRHFRTNVSYQYNEIDLRGGSFVTRIARVTLEAVFSSSLSWINMIQYDNVSETIGVNSRLHWIPRAGREAFLVLNHNLADPERDNSFVSSFSEVTLKYSYTFRF